MGACGGAAAPGFVFLMDQGGNDNAQVYYEPGNGAVRALTHGDFIHGSAVWAHDGKRARLLRQRPRLGELRRLRGGRELRRRTAARWSAASDDTWYPLDWSPDDSKLLVWKYLSLSESYLYLADTASGALTPLEDKPKKVGIRTARFDPAGAACTCSPTRTASSCS